MLIRNAITAIVGLALLALAFVGFIIPILPGFLFLALALLCFVAVSPALARRLDRYPTWRAWHVRWRLGAGLPLLDRARLMFWLGADSAFQSVSTRKPR